MRYLIIVVSLCLTVLCLSACGPHSSCPGRRQCHYEPVHYGVNKTNLHLRRGKFRGDYTHHYK